MAQDMILLQPGAMPAHIANNPPPVSLNANAQQGVRLTFPVVSIEGRVWSVTLRGVETVIKASEGTDYNGKPLPEAPVRSLNVIIVGISPTISKVWYAKAFQPGQKAVLPDCFSINGETPDPTSPLRQSELCSTCPKNQFESAVSDDGTQGKGKACRDSRKIAVVPAGDIQNAIFGGPMMLRLPVMSLPNLAKYCGQLNIAGVDVTQVVTAMSFNMTVKYPEVVFRPQQVEGSVVRSGTSDVKLSGVFSIHGVDHALTAEVHANLSRDHWTGTGKFQVPYISWGI